MYRYPALHRCRKFYLPEYKTRSFNPMIAAKESKVLGTSTIIRTHYNYDRYIRYVHEYLGTVTKLPFVPSHVDKSYLTYSMPKGFNVNRYVHSLVRTDPGCLWLLCLHFWIDREIELTGMLQYDGNIDRIVYSVLLLIQRGMSKGCDSRVILKDLLVKMVDAIRTHNPTLYQRLQTAREHFDVWDFLGTYNKDEIFGKRFLATIVEFHDEHLA